MLTTAAESLNTYAPARVGAFLKGKNMNESLNLAMQIIKFEEGFQEVPYICTEGFLTIGYGTRITSEGDGLTAVITREIAGKLILGHLLEIDKELDLMAEFTYEIERNSARKAIILSMCYQLGIAGFLKFKLARLAWGKLDFDKAASEMLDSKWFKQTSERCKRHAEVVRTGKMDIYEGLV